MSLSLAAVTTTVGKPTSSSWATNWSPRTLRANIIIMIDVGEKRSGSQNVNVLLDPVGEMLIIFFHSSCQRHSKDWNQQGVLLNISLHLSSMTDNVRSGLKACDMSWPCTVLP